MNTKKEIHALIVERNNTLAESIEKILEHRQYRVTCLSKREDIPRLLRRENYSLAVIGEAEDGISPFQMMKDMVMASPMTSMILITDLPNEVVDEKAEGYGILGHAGKDIRREEIVPLLESFEQILRSV